jgi:hypothetical protein
MTLPYNATQFVSSMNDGSSLYYETCVALSNDDLAMESLEHAVARGNEEFALSLWVSLQRPFVARLVQGYFTVVSLDSETQTQIDDFSETHQYGVFEHEGKLYEGYCRIHHHGFSQHIGWESLLYGNLVTGV